MIQSRYKRKLVRSRHVHMSSSGSYLSAVNQILSEIRSKTFILCNFKLKRLSEKQSKSFILCNFKLKRLSEKHSKQFKSKIK